MIFCDSLCFLRLLTRGAKIHLHIENANGYSCSVLCQPIDNERYFFIFIRGKNIENQKYIVTTIMLEVIMDLFGLFSHKIDLF